MAHWRGHLRLTSVSQAQSSRRFLANDTSVSPARPRKRERSQLAAREYPASVSRNRPPRASLDRSLERAAEKTARGFVDLEAIFFTLPRDSFRLFQRPTSVADSRWTKKQTGSRRILHAPGHPSVSYYLANDFCDELPRHDSISTLEKTRSSCSSAKASSCVP